jgi:hypothetical protein
MDEEQVDIRSAKLRKCNVELPLNFRWMVRIIPKFRGDEEVLAPYQSRYDFLQSVANLCCISLLETIDKKMRRLVVIGRASC